MKSLLYLFCILLFTACEKELSLEGGAFPTPPEPNPAGSDTVPKFILAAFYSDVPIDFDETDEEIKAETELWAYVFDYLKDDHHLLHADGTLEVQQNDKKMPGLNDAVLYRTYLIGADDAGLYMNYLTAEYRASKYRLYEMTDDHFIIGVRWKDEAILYSRFDRIN